MKLKVAIIGGGASGVSAALALQEKCGVTIFEREQSLLTKLLKTGNGKANIYRRDPKAKHYNDESFMNHHIISLEQTLDDFFAKLKILTYTDEHHRVYPYSRSAKTLQQLLISKITSETLLNTNVTRIKHQNNGYLVNDRLFDVVILATGSSASLCKYNLTNENEGLLQSLKLSYITPHPVIKTIPTTMQFIDIENIRVNATLSLFKDDDMLVQDKGELMFKKQGLSGIVSFIISSYFEWQYLKNPNHQYELEIDFMPDYSLTDLEKLLVNREMLYNIFQTPLALFLLKVSKTYQGSLASLIKKFRVTPLSQIKSENAQAHHGGVCVDTINPLTFELKNHRNIFVSGELLDIDGICGGYNLGFAFYSGLKIADAIIYKCCQ